MPKLPASVPDRVRSYGHPSNPPTPSAECVIYCRVSSAKQVREGDGLGSQELSCRNYAALRGYSVLAVFTDGITGGISGRKGLHELLAFLEQRPPGLVVIIDDIKRFARDVEVHFGLKRTIVHCGARLESPLFRFEDTPEGKFIETMMAAQAELERNQNKRQVVSRMKARMEQGFWVLAAPPGYTYRHHPLLKKQLVPDENAPRIREALEGFASGRFPAIADVERFLLAHGFYDEKQTYRGSRLSRVLRLLSNVVYSGWIEFLPWAITLRKGQHEGLISYETYERIQERLQNRTNLRTEHVQRRVFPLRGILLCEGCHRHLTASQSRGKQGKYYDYYRCPRRECLFYGKSLPCATVEEAFAALIGPLTMTDEEYYAVEQILHLNHARDAQALQRTRSQMEAEVVAVDKRVEELIEAISRTHHPTVMESLEGKVDDLVQQRGRIVARLTDSATPLSVDVGNLLNEVGDLLRNPLQVWKTGDARIRHLLAKIALDQSVVYSRKTGFETPNFSLPYRVFRVYTDSRSGLVDQKRLISNSETDSSMRAIRPTEEKLPDDEIIRQVVEALVGWRELLRDER